MIWQLPGSKSSTKVMSAKAAGMLAVSMPVRAMPAKIIQSGKVLARLVVASHPDIMGYLNIWHPINLKNIRVPAMSLSSMAAVSRKTVTMMTTQLWRELDISEPASPSSAGGR
jgi:hypothetical protein